jgi:hypothetical protein
MGPFSPKMGDMKEDELWGEVPGMELSFGNVGDCKHQIIVQHLEYSKSRDSDSIDDVITQCAPDAQASPSHHDPLNPTLYYAHETKISMPPEDYHPEPTPSGSKILNSLRACMSGGERGESYL